MHDALLLALVLLLAIVFDFINGFHDTANAIATTVLTRALSISQAIALAAVLNFAGALISTSVAKTIGKGIVPPAEVTQTVVAGALLGAIMWNLLTWRMGLPSSSSHALIGGLVGSTLIARGVGVVEWGGLQTIFLSLLISPLVGFLAGGFLMVGISWVFRHARPAPLNRKFKRLQVLSAAAMAVSHGMGDAQKTMGVMTMALVAYSVHHGPAHAAPTAFDVLLWIKLTAATAMAIGTAAGGWRIIKTVGEKMVTGMQPVHGFAAETAGAAVILTASHFGWPVSTTHCISSSIMGVGSARSSRALRFGVLRKIFLAWTFTLPICAIAGGVCYFLLHALLD